MRGRGMWNLRLAVSAFVCLFVRTFEGRLREVCSKACHGTYPTSKTTKNDILKSPQKISRCPGRPNARHFVAGQGSKIQNLDSCVDTDPCLRRPCRARLVLVFRDLTDLGTCRNVSRQFPDCCGGLIIKSGNPVSYFFVVFFKRQKAKNTEKIAHFARKSDGRVLLSFK